MEFQAEIKKVATTRKEDAVEAQVTLQFLVRGARDVEALLDLMQLQDQIVIVTAESVQQDFPLVAGR